MEPKVSRARLQIGDWLVDPSLDEVHRGETRIKLEPRKMQLLVALAQRPGELVTTEELLETVWAGAVVTQSSLYQSIAQLRRTLGDETESPTFIATIPRKGYRLIAPVARVDETHGPTDRATTPAPQSNREPPAAATKGRIERARLDRRWLTGAAAAGLTVALGAASGWWARTRPHPDPSRLAIAVLPFADISPGGVEQPVADGLASEVIAALSANRQVRVSAPSSAFQFRHTSLPLREVGRQLGVTHVLDGELFRTRERVRLTVRLRAVADGDIVWHDALEQPVEETSGLPLRVAQSALVALHAPGALSSTPAPSAQAYELYLLGHHFLQPRTPESIVKARDYFQRAVEVDPSFALAYVGLARSWIAEYQYGSGLTVRNMDARAQPQLDRALGLQPDLPEALATQGYLKTVLNRFDEARPFLERAVAAQPQNATSLLWLGINEAYDGFPRKALERYARVAELDPLQFIVHVRSGLESIHAGLYDDAARHYARAVELAPHHPNTHWGAGLIGLARGRLDDAVRGYRRALQADSRREELWTQLGWIYLDLGMPQDARNAFAQAIALAGSPAQPQAALARAFIVEGDLPGLERYLAENQLPPPGIRDVEIETAVLFAVLGKREAAHRALISAVGPMLADPVPLYGPWFTCFGQHVFIDVATVYTWLGEPEEARSFLDQAFAYVDRYERQGNVWHAIGYHKARIAAMRGDGATALAQLEKAVDLGWRRGWWLRVDPALASLRSSPRFQAVLERIETETRAQRERLSADPGVRVP
ncbi:MAG TPA: winged helix-turn-helix domain-containing protein [Myxococcaceae bacterium]|nr:winged helix-turn-helix domain-containing protein [Myxococcaceae bacterium]